MNFSHQRLLYIIQHKNNRMFRIGIATDNSRFKDLDRDYSIDWNKSIYFIGENDDIQQTEKILHRLFFKYRLEKQNGTGGTEWFDIKCMEKLVDSLIFNIKHSDFNILLEPNEIVLYDDEIINEEIENSESQKEKQSNKQLSWYEYRKSIFDKYPKNIVEEWLELEKSSDPNTDIKMNELIPELMVLHKPKELLYSAFHKISFPKIVKWQVIPFKNYNKLLIKKVKTTKEFCQLSPNQFDILNLMIYTVNKNFKKEFGSTENIIKIIKTDFEKIEKKMNNEWFTLTWKEITEFLDRYKHGEYKKIDNELYDMMDIKLTTNVLENNKVVGETTFHLLKKYRSYKHKIKFQLEPELIFIFLLLYPYTDELYVPLKIKLQAQQLKTVGAKRLYEILKDYQNVTKIFSFNDLLIIMNVNPEAKTNKLFGTFNRTHLKKAVKEINEKSDIYVEYEPIKERPKEGGRLRVTKIKFTMRKQPESRLKELGLLDQPEELSIEEQILLNKIKLKSRAKLDKLIKTGYKVRDEDAWIETDIKKNRELYEAQCKLDDYLQELEELPQNEKLELMSSLASYLNSNDPVVIIKDYKIEDLSGNPLTLNAIEIRKVILEFQEETYEDDE